MPQYRLISHHPMEDPAGVEFTTPLTAARGDRGRMM
jgi:hypothetical protein